MEFLHALYTNMTSTVVPQTSCTIIINFASFWLQYYEYVYHYDRDPTNHFVGVYNHRRFYSCKQNNNYSLIYMNNCIAINMIKSYSCSTQTPNNTYLGFNTNPESIGSVR